jgi:phospholipid/cholesterol/gamma-HCH transport system ATP-binding protein
MKSETSYSSDSISKITNLKKSVGDNNVLRDFTLNVKQGENVVVIGKSGSGKSVLIKCIIGLMHPDSGNISVFGEDVSALSNIELDEMRAKVGFLFQSNALYDSMTVRENLEFPLRRHWIKTTKETMLDLVKEALSNVGLLETLNLKPNELSGGMKKRIALARTLILKPKIILYDEPTSGLDPITGKEISRLIVDVQKKYSASSIIISHDLNCAKIASNKIAMLIDGICYATGSYEEIIQSADSKVKQFFD